MIIMFATYQVTNNPAIPAIVHLGNQETPVWIQSYWEEGEFAQYIRRNGCGHCCAAMAASLYGIHITPYEEYLLCLKLWGAPEEDQGQDHFQTVSGIVKILNHLNIPAQCFPVAEDGQEAAADHIYSCLQEGKQAIFVSDPFRDPGNPFSTGYHYVMAVGFDENGSILIANSSEKTAKGGIQTVSLPTIQTALYAGGTADPNMTWGMVEVLHKGCTYVIVG
jgi:hypothetical protein